MAKRQPPPPGFDEGFQTRTLIRVHFVCGLIAAAVVGKIVDSLGYNATPWALGTALATVVILAIVLAVKRRRDSQGVDPGT